METDSDVIKSSDELPEVVNERCHARVAVKPGFIQNLFQPGDISLAAGGEGGEEIFIQGSLTNFRGSSSGDEKMQNDEQNCSKTEVRIPSNRRIQPHPRTRGENSRGKFSRIFIEGKKMQGDGQR
ncbi:hypothetical protein K0M31_012982, partial [Melipona bicolor]